MPIMTDKADGPKAPEAGDSGAAQAEPAGDQAVRTGEASGQAIRDALADAEQFDGFLFWDHPSGYQFDMMQRCRSSALRAAFGIITGEVGRAGFYARKAASDAFRAVPALRGEAK